MNFMNNESNTRSKFEPQGQYPDPHEMTDQTYFSLMKQYLALPNFGANGIKKRHMLKLMGVEQSRIEELCKPMEYSREQCMKDVKELSRQEQKKLRKWDRERRLRVEMTRN